MKTEEVNEGDAETEQHRKQWHWAVAKTDQTVTCAKQGNHNLKQKKTIFPKA